MRAVFERSWGQKMLGLIIRDLKADALDSTESPVDFGQLFIGFSFFVILAALAITGMIFNLFHGAAKPANWTSSSTWFTNEDNPIHFSGRRLTYFNNGGSTRGFPGL